MKPGLRVITGAAAAEASELSAEAFQAACVEGFVASWPARGFSPVTIENGTGVLDRFLDLLEIPAWEAGPDDVDRLPSKSLTSSPCRFVRKPDDR